VPTNYQRGRAFEYRVRNALKKRGAAYVMRAAQSKGIADLLALWPARVMNVPDRPWLVQVKYSITGKGGRLSAHEEIELIALADLTGGIPILATQGPKGRGVVFTDLRTKEQL
jgi:Holliday junction resolvase